MFRDATLVIIPPPIKKKKKKGSDFSRSQYMVTLRGKRLVIMTGHLEGFQHD